MSQFGNHAYESPQVKETAEKGYLDCYIGDNYDDYLFTIEGRIYDGDLADKIESMYG